MALVISALTVKYRKRTAVDGVSWRLGKGFHALLGPNDAEKSSLLRAVATLQPMASGTVTLGDDNGHLSDTSIRQSLGYCPQENLGRSRLTVREHLAYMCWPHRIPDSQSRTETERVTEVMDLTDRADDTTSSRSGGMRRRLGVGSALVGRPSLVVLDEPSAGLDVAQRESLRSAETRLHRCDHHRVDAHRRGRTRSCWSPQPALPSSSPARDGRYPKAPPADTTAGHPGVSGDRRRGLGRAGAGARRTSLAIPAGLVIAVISGWTLISSLSWWGGSPRLLLAEQMPSSAFIHTMRRPPGRGGRPVPVAQWSRGLAAAVRTPRGDVVGTGLRQSRRHRRRGSGRAGSRPGPRSNRRSGLIRCQRSRCAPRVLSRMDARPPRPFRGGRRRSDRRLRRMVQHRLGAPPCASSWPSPR